MSFSRYVKDPQYRHVLGLSGGKDSAALAIYLKDRYPEIHEKIEYFFSDTGAELKEVYDYLDRLEAYLGKEIKRLNSGHDFDWWLTQHNEYLPSAKQRWCTLEMKIKPFERFIGDSPVVSYIGIRADENREGYISSKPTIKPVFPYIEDGLIKSDIFQILENSIGVPEYYRWRSRSGCYFCFFQRQDEWLGLKRNHPELFEKAKAYEMRKRNKYDWKEGEVNIGYGFTWSSQGTLDEIVERAEIKEAKGKVIMLTGTAQRWQDLLAQEEDDDHEDQACLICTL